jgi:hypothetical protein
MWPYIIVASLVAVAAITGGSRRPDKLMWMLFFLLITLFVGLRHRVGMDWNNYLRMIDKASRIETSDQLLTVAEPLYALLLWWGSETGYGIYAVNLIATVVFAYGLFRFARSAPEPWLAIMASLPIYVVVVAMSANRQAVACGLLMWLVADWYKVTPFRRTLWIFLAAGFHFSALVFLAFVGMDLKVRPWLKAVALAVFSAVIIYTLQASGHADYYDSAYGRGQTEATQSSGAWMHVSINAVPAMFYFLFPQHRAIMFPTSLSRQMAFAAIATLPLVFIASAAAGRISLYWYPVSIWVWSSFPFIFTARSRALARAFAVLTMLAILYGWLLSANSSYAHIPYRNALLIEPWELHIGLVP